MPCLRGAQADTVLCPFRRFIPLRSSLASGKLYQEPAKVPTGDTQRGHTELLTAFFRSRPSAGPHCRLQTQPLHRFAGPRLVAKRSASRR